MLIALNFHYVRPVYDFPHQGIVGVKPDELEAQVRLLSQLGPFLNATEVERIVLGEVPVPPVAFVVTMDDGLREQFEHAMPVLESLGVPALFFVNTRPIAEGVVDPVHQLQLLRSTVTPDTLLSAMSDAAASLGVDLNAMVVDDEVVRRQYHYDPPAAARLKYLLNVELELETKDRIVGHCFEHFFPGAETDISRELYMDVAQVKELAGRGMIGSHAHDHVPLGRLAPAEAARQLVTSKALLEAWTGRTMTGLSYPYGGQNTCVPVVAAARAAGYTYGFSMERAANHRVAEPLLLARFACNDLPGGSQPHWTINELLQQVPDGHWGEGLVVGG